MMTKQLTRTTTTLFLSAFLVSATPCLAAETTNTPEPKREQQVDGLITIADLADRVEPWFKAKIIVGTLGGMKVQMNLGKEPLSYGQFLTQLNASGFTAFKSSGYIQIIPNREARNMAIPVVEKKQSYSDDEYVTDFLKTDKACASRVLAVLRPLVPQYGHLSVYDEAKTLVIVDTYSNIQRIKAAIKVIESNLDEPEDCGRKKSDAIAEKK